MFLTLWWENGEKDLGWYLRNTWTDHHSHPLLGIPFWGCTVLFQRHPQSRGFPHTGRKLLLFVSESERKSREILENPGAKQEYFTSAKAMLPLYFFKEMRHSLFFSENNHTWYYENMGTNSQVNRKTTILSIRSLDWIISLADLFRNQEPRESCWHISVLFYIFNRTSHAWYEFAEVLQSKQCN